MENASKALLIAGAILLVIALIAVGMSIFGGARGTVDKSKGQVDNIKVQMHNKQFEEYEGTGISLNKVKELVSLVGSNNNNSQYIIKFELCGYKNLSDNGKFTNVVKYANSISDINNSGLKNFIISGKDIYGLKNNLLRKFIRR